MKHIWLHGSRVTEHYSYSHGRAAHISAVIPCSVILADTSLFALSATVLIIPIPPYLQYWPRILSLRPAYAIHLTWIYQVHERGLPTDTEQPIPCFGFRSVVSSYPELITAGIILDDRIIIKLHPPVRHKSLLLLFARRQGLVRLPKNVAGYDKPQNRAHYESKNQQKD